MVSTLSEEVPKYSYMDFFCSSERLAPRVTTLELSAFATIVMLAQVRTAASMTGMILFIFLIMPGVIHHAPFSLFSQGLRPGYKARSLRFFHLSPLI